MGAPAAGEQAAEPYSAGEGTGRVWVLAVFGRLLLPRWPVVLAAPLFADAGYTTWQVLALTVSAAVLTEVAFAIVRVLLLDREH